MRKWREEKNHHIDMETKIWFCIKYLIHEAWIGEDWRKFENWEDAQGYAELMYGSNLWSITNKSSKNQ
jgi:hypothetical protein